VQDACWVPVAMRCDEPVCRYDSPLVREALGKNMTVAEHERCLCTWASFSFSIVV
jgi:hypothetical protein